MNLKYIGLNLALVISAFLAGVGFHQEKRNQAPLPTTILASNAAKTAVKPVLKVHSIQVKTSSRLSTDALSADEIKDLLSGLGPLNSEKAYDRMNALLLALAAKDPKAAVDYVLHTLRPPFQDEALPGVLGVWAGSDGLSAWSWVKTNQPGNSLITGTVLNKVASSQPDLAWQFATELATNMPDQAAGLYVSAMSGMMYTGKYLDAARLLDSAILGTNSAQSSLGLTGLLASQWGAFAPTDAAQWILSLPEGDSQNQALIALGQAWGNAAPEQAIAFASQLPPSGERVSMLESGLNSWMSSDPAAADKWMSSVSAGPDYDQLASAIAATPALINETPENSVAWAMSISDENQKMESVVNVFTQWFHSADASAMAYLKQMPPDVQSEVCNRLGLVYKP